MIRFSFGKYIRQVFIIRYVYKSPDIYACQLPSAERMWVVYVHLEGLEVLSINKSLKVRSSLKINILGNNIALKKGTWLIFYIDWTPS